MTQEKLAEAVGVSTSTIQRWEYADDAPEFDRLETLAKALNVKTEDFFKDLGV
jgi:transcriptional regulator with XRE-family HTH domain